MTSWTIDPDSSTDDGPGWSATLIHADRVERCPASRCLGPHQPFRAPLIESGATPMLATASARRGSIAGRERTARASATPVMRPKASIHRRARADGTRLRDTGDAAQGMDRQRVLPAAPFRKHG
jgi:hypothetical protein